MNLLISSYFFHLLLQFKKYFKNCLLILTTKGLRQEEFQDISIVSNEVALIIKFIK